MTLDEIKAAVESGKKVHWRSLRYTVVKDNLDQWLICCKGGRTLDLTHQDGVTLNGDPYDFFVSKPLNYVKVFAKTGETWETSIKGTREDAENYFIGREFNIGKGAHDYMVTVDRIEYTAADPE